MKKFLLALALAFGLSSRASATILTGTIQYSDGRPINGQLTLAVTHRANVKITGTCGGPQTIVPESPKSVNIVNGSPPTGTTVVGTDCLQPAGTYYQARLVDSVGTLVLNEFWPITGASVDIGTILAIPNPGAIPQSLNGDVTGDVTQDFISRLQGYPVNVTTPSANQGLMFNGTTWINGNIAGSGTVTSVGLALPAGVFSISNSPVVSAGTLTGAFISQAQNTVFIAPNGSSGTPTFRLLVAADIPALPESGITNLTTDLANRALTSTQIIAGAGLTGSGTLAANTTLSVPAAGITDSMIASTPGSTNTASTIVKRDGSGNFAAGTITATLSGNATNVSGIVGIANGGTNGATAAAGFDNLSPTTTQGDIAYRGASSNNRLAGNTTTTKQFLSETGNGVTANNPAWGAIAAGDVPNIAESQVTNLTTDLSSRALNSQTVTATLPLSASGTLGGLTLSVAPCVGAGAGHAAGTVPDPGAVNNNYFLRQDCTFQPVPSAGVPTTRNVNTGLPLTGGGALSSDLSLNINIFQPSGGGHATGIVPDPGASAGTTRALFEDATFKSVVTSIGLSLPADFTVTNSPVTTSGTINVVRASQAQGLALMSPAGSSGAPTFRGIATTDVPNLPESQITNLVSDLAAKVPTSRNITTTAPITGTSNLSSDITLALTYAAGGCISNNSGLTITTGCITPAMLSPGAGFVKTDGTTTMTNNWNFGAENLGINVNPTAYALHVFGGGERVQILANPFAPSVTPQGVTGGTTYTYFIVAHDRNGNTTLVSPSGQTTTGNATLTGSNYNQITWSAVTGAANYDVLKNDTAHSVATNLSALTFNDIGGATSAYTNPPRNNTGDMAVDGQLTTGTLSTATFTSSGTITGNNFISTVATGTAPLTVSSTTPVANLALSADTQLPTISTAGKVSNSATTATSANTASAIVARDGSGNFTAGTITAALTGNATGFTGSLVGDVTGTQGATVVSSVGGSTAANVHSAELAANAATNLNTVSTIVKRDGSGNFSAGTITASLTGNASGSAASFTGNLAGDVTGPQGTTVVATVGTSTAANVHTAELAANAATNLNTASTIVKRDGSGNFTAGTMTGNVTGSAGSFTGSLVGDVTGTQGATAVALVGGSTAANVHNGELLANAATNANTPSTIVKRDGSGNFTAGTITATQLTGAATQLKDATGVVDVSAATAPTVGQTLVATGASTATWQTLAGAGSVTSITTTAPVTGCAAPCTSTATLGLSVTPANPGGAVALQGATPGTQQTGNLNLSGTGLLGELGLSQLGATDVVLHINNVPGSIGSGLPLIVTDSLNAGSNFSGVAARESRGSFSVPTATNSGDTLGLFGFFGYGTTGYASAADASIFGLAKETFSDTAHGAKLIFKTTLAGSVGAVERGSFQDSGQFIVHQNAIGALQSVTLASRAWIETDNQATQDSRGFANYWDAANKAQRGEFFYGSCTTCGGSPTNPSMWFVAQNTNGVAGTGSIHFMTGDGNGANSQTDATVTEALTLADGGNVGVHQNQPGHPLEIGQSSSTVPSMYIKSVDGNNTSLLGFGLGTGLALDWFLGTNQAGLTNTDFVLYDKINTTAKVDVQQGTTGGVGLSATAQGHKSVTVGGPMIVGVGAATLVNGLNSNITLVDSQIVRISGPSAAFSVGGFTVGLDGRLLTLYNTTAQAMTIVNQDASSTAANRISTLTGANVVLRTGTSSATFFYDGTSSRWILTATN